MKWLPLRGGGAGVESDAIALSSEDSLKLCDGRSRMRGARSGDRGGGSPFLFVSS